jgi:hypothetical protein
MPVAGRADRGRPSGHAAGRAGAGVHDQGGVVPWCGFVLYDERDSGYQPFVIVQTPHAAVYASDESDIETYREHLAAIRQAALFGNDALAAIRVIADSM